MTPATLTIDSITYNVVSTRQYEAECFGGIKESRTRYVVKRPRGRKLYAIFQYGNGTFSSPIALGAY
jgi:hypothetical protein